jgi:cytochrome b subunit of formate dehydrogenase
VLFIIAFFRARHSAHDFADRNKEAQLLDSGIKTEGQDNTRIFGRPFVTAGWTVVQVTVAVAVVELALLGLIIRQVLSFFFHSCHMDCSHLSCHRHNILESLCTCITYDHLYQYAIIFF